MRCINLFLAFLEFDTNHIQWKNRALPPEFVRKFRIEKITNLPLAGGPPTCLRPAGHKPQTKIIPTETQDPNHPVD